MPLDPSIPLSFKAPEATSPIANISQIMQMRGLASEVALRNAQTEQAQQNAKDLQVQAEGRRADLTDQNTMRELMSDPATAKQIGSGDLTPLYGKIQQK